MGLFKKKPDPVSERAKALDEKIAALQEEIQKLSEQASSPPPPAEPPAPAPTARRPSAPTPAHSTSSIPNFTVGAPPAPRLRSTALPHRPFPAGDSAPSHEPIFEEVNQPRIKADTEPPTPAPEELGTRKANLSSFWRRVARHFRGPVTSNPKLVNYLAAGSIQGLQPLRYEKRVARNRFIVFAVFLALALWGLVAMLFGRR